MVPDAIFVALVAILVVWIGVQAYLLSQKAIASRKSAELATAHAERIAAMEAQLREQAPMAQLGEMSTVIAHEVKNPLAGIRGAVEVLSSRMEAGSGDAAVAHQIIERVDALNEMMKALVFFARPPRLKPQTIQLRPLIESAAGLVGRDPALAGTVFEFSGEAPPIVADQDMLRTVFQNVITNSAQAMGGKGIVSLDVATDSTSCVVTVSDGGPGIPPEILGKVFTPFVTTKSQRPGLGLATARRIVEAHRGEIAIAKSSARGTTVVIRLPMALHA